jgi:hypothetical protein
MVVVGVHASFRVDGNKLGVSILVLFDWLEPLLRMNEKISFRSGF